MATAERAANEKRYLKSDLEFLGATVGDIRKSVRAVVRDHKWLDHDQLVALVEELWRKPIHERRMAAVVLLESRVDLLTGDDLDLLERLIRESKTWALVDGLASKVTGALA
ncbi:MAG TPA: DNA alkylation repair protein, partial [Actinomycetota bacterium]|nr:DNA alkylation repair protein [Actinomycetota bacterium]